MKYYNYHAKAIELIKNNHCIKAEIVDNWNTISPALVLFFDNHSPMPIRIYKWENYFKILKSYNIKIIKQ